MSWFNAIAGGPEKVGAQSLETDGSLRHTGEGERLKAARGGGPGRGPGRRVGLAPVGRVVLWAFVGLVLVRGVGAIFGSGDTTDRSTAAAADERRFPDDEARAFAVRFTHTYLGGSKQEPETYRREVAAYFAEDLRERTATVLPESGSGARVVWATVARESALGRTRALITVAVLTGEAVRYLTVPVEPPRREPPRVPPARLRAALLATPQIIVKQVLMEPTEFGAATDGTRWPAVLTFMLRNFLLNARPDYGNALARTWALHAQGNMAGFASARPQLRDVYKWLEEDSFGLAVEDQIALAFALRTEAGRSDPPGYVRHAQAIDLLTNLGVAHSDAEDAVGLLAGDRAWFRSQLEAVGTDPTALAWSVFPYLTRPFLKRENGDLILLSPRGAEAWGTTGIYYRLLASARNRDKSHRFTAQLGASIEDHVVHVARASFAKSRLLDCGSVLGELPYGKGGGKKTSDLAIVFDNDIVLVEVCSSRITLPSRLIGDEKQVLADVDKVLIAKVRQLAPVVRAIPGLENPTGARVWPLVVTNDSFGAAPEIWRLLESQVPELLDEPNVCPLEILDFEDFEILLGLVEQDYHLVELLERKQRVGHRYWDLRRWIANDPEVHVGRRAHGVDAAWNEFKSSVTGRLNLATCNEDLLGH